MKIIEIKTYPFDELSETAKETARQRYREHNGDYLWADEAMESIKALARHFGGKMYYWAIDWGDTSYSEARFDMPALEFNEIEERLSRLGTFDPKTLMGHGDCKLTGVCFDEDAIDGFRIAWHKGERDLEKLMDAAFKTWLEAAQADYAAQMEDEQVDSHLISNDYYFTEDGKQFRH